MGAADAVDGVFAGQGEQGGVGADSDEAQALVGVSAGGLGIGSEDAGGQTGRVGGGQDLAQGVLKRGCCGVAGYTEVVGPLKRDARSAHRG